jgi:sulfite exporter TauE/SafE
MMPKKVREMHNFSSHNKELQNEDVTKLTPWILFLIFVFGPCEVLIPLLIFPAAEFNAFGIAAVSIVFGIATITTMMFSVYIGNKGVSLIKVKNGEKFFHLIAGLVILISGAGMQFMGW